MFLGRKNEIDKLMKFMTNPNTKAAMIYGRRRVGKSGLITHCLGKTNTKYLYYECNQTSEQNNINNILGLLSDLYNIPPLQINDIGSLLKYIYSSVKEELIFVLDEYPYLREVVTGLDSIFQTILDQNRDSKVKLILCGSYVEIMKNILEEENPLYGRFDFIMELKPMDYYESSLFYPNLSLEDKVRMYSVLGGIPYYNLLVDDQKTVKENIISLVASNGARLETEISGYLKTQLSNINNANEAIEILANGYYKYSDIYEQANIKKGPTLIDALDKLISMGLVSKVSPINDENNKKKTGYVIVDPLSCFYYKYIYKNKSRLIVMNNDMFYDLFIKEDFENQYVPKYFEIISKEYLIRKNKEGLITPPFDKIGKYYYDDPKNHKNGEFDVVTHDEMGYMFYEVKFRNKPLSNAMIEEEIKQIKECGIDCERYGFISKSGFVEKNESITQITLEDLYR